MDIALLAGSAFAIALLSFTAAKLFPTASSLTKQKATAAFSRVFPGASIKKITIDSKEGAVFLQTEGGQLGLVLRMGDRLICRLYDRTDPLNLTVAGHSVTFDFLDFTQPPRKFTFEPTELDQLTQIVQPWLTVCDHPE